jgi:hypothetical protein
MKRRLKPYTVLSLGGGLDSFAMLLDAIERGELPDLVIFADVGDPARLDPGEWPSTYRHLEQVVQPLCDSIGVEFKWLDTDESPIRGERSLFKYFERTTSMPTRMSRMCTCAAKVERIVRYLDERIAKPRPLEVWIGFESGEENRAATDPHAKGRAKGRRVNRFPLIERGLCRCRCEALVESWGFPVPRKSACTYCPFSSRGDFITLRDELPDVFARVVQLEERCKITSNDKRLRYGYLKGDGTDPALPRWLTHCQRKDDKLSPYKSAGLACDVCGQQPRATKATGCDWLSNGGTAAQEAS